MTVDELLEQDVLVIELASALITLQALVEVLGLKEIPSSVVYIFSFGSSGHPKFPVPCQFHNRLNNCDSAIVIMAIGLNCRPKLIPLLIYIQ